MMNKTLLSGLGVAGVLAITLVGSYISAYNAGNSAEKVMQAVWSDSENISAQYSLQVAEAAQVPAAMREDLKDVIKTTMMGRFGEGGSKATFQWFKEQNINVSPELYIKIQQIIEGGRNKVANKMTTAIEMKRSYSDQLGSFWRGTWLRVAGYPKINLDDFKVISTDTVREEYKSGTAAPITIFKSR